MPAQADNLFDTLDYIAGNVLVAQISDDDFIRGQFEVLVGV